MKPQQCLGVAAMWVSSVCFADGAPRQISYPREFTLPEYPAEAVAARLEGEVTLKFKVNETGLPKALEVVDSVPKGRFDPAVLIVASRWKFAPMGEGCVPLVPDRMVKVGFRLEGSQPKVSVRVLPVAAGPALDPTGTPLMARTISKTPPYYPAEALDQGIKGKVDVAVLIGPAGEITEAILAYAEPDRTFDKAALESLRQWRFEPFIDQGVAKPYAACVSLQFKTKE
ncbi:energy transducer TonB [Parachitinimonas caeni]|uniref:Energy transducer TonB n=1 Tax=Parachitinimonas caeni TaxID=3031301 RepID=A0ABT7DTI7_9NEIS|nr:energy transducer TonB [Parachitinimonas caeni]MDK2123396.1 energy transducer TonB [Parachitinimonas caeni]